MTRNSALDQVAQTWAQKMADTAASGVAPKDALQHDVTGNGPTYPGGYQAAVRADCSHCNGWSENIAYDTSPGNAWSGWLKSCGHQHDIAYASAGEYGVGVASGGGYLWLVQDFGYYNGSPARCNS